MSLTGSNLLRQRPGWPRLCFRNDYSCFVKNAVSTGTIYLGSVVNGQQGHVRPTRPSLTMPTRQALLSRLLPSLPRVVLLGARDFCNDDRGSTCNLSVGFSPTQPSLRSRLGVRQILDKGNAV